MSTPAPVRPRWATNPGSGYPGAIEPNDGKKDNGFANGEEPAAGHFNWLFQNGSDYSVYVATKSEILRALNCIMSAQFDGGSLGTMSSATGVFAMSEPENQANSTQTLAQRFRQFPCWASCKTNAVDVLVGTGVASLNHYTPTGAWKAIYGRHHGNNGPAFIVVGDAGKWWRQDASGGSATSGTISGTPNLTRIIWDSTNGVWWACGPGGIYRASDHTSPTTLTWTQVSAVQHDEVCATPSGRVVFYRASNSTLYYTDDMTTLVAGATGVTLTGKGLVWDNTSECVVSCNGYTADGVVWNAFNLALGMDFFVWTVFTFRGRAYIRVHEGADETVALLYYRTTTISADQGDWGLRPVIEQSLGPADISIAGSDEQMVIAASPALYITKQIAQDAY